MLHRRRPEDTGGLLRLRHTDEAVGLLVLLAVVLFFGAIFEAGVVRHWLNPDSRLRILLPQSDFGGLAPGAAIDVLGTQMGSVDRIVLNPDGRIYATASIERQADPYIRRDSTATIRLRYGVAGAAYIDVSRGKGAAMDWSFAVIQATVQPNPTELITKTLKQVRTELLPIMAHANQATATLDALLAGLKAGHGTAGQLLTDDTLIRNAEAMVATLKSEVAQLQPVEAKLPGLLDQSHAVLANAKTISRNAAVATRQLPAITKNVAVSTSNLPALLIQAQATTEQLEKLLQQLRGSWLLGGGASKPETLRLPSRQVRP
ncbi:MlaD family protein [Lichenicoccus sp.]|uniref:MlaD family protein n=1 Tax=Lichenicoccus sp. TaxID=2781899 RepID=UPI003D113E7D